MTCTPTRNQPCHWCHDHLASDELAPCPTGQFVPSPHLPGHSLQIFALAPVCECCASGALRDRLLVLPVLGYAT